jgi:serine/threonine protein kinase
MKNDTLESLVSKGKTEEALQQLSELLKDMDSSYSTQVDLLQNRINEANNRANKGVESAEQLGIERNRINSSLLDLLNEVRNALRDQFTFLQSSIQKSSKINLKDYVNSRARGKYMIGDVIKEGTSLINFRAMDCDTEREVIIKVLKVDYLNDSEDAKIIDDFREEVKKVSKLKHRNIIKIRDVFFAETPVYIVTDYIWGVDIAELIASIGSIPFFLALEIILELCEVLEYLRYRQIFHASIRPDKIMLDDENKPMISPFEVIKAGSGKRVLEKFREDCSYLSPELFDLTQNVENEPDTMSESEKNDQFSLGLLAYEMLTGQALFPRKINGVDLSIPAIIRNRDRFFANTEGEQEKKWKKLRESGCPPEFVTIVERLLEEKPRNRFNNIWELSEQLRVLKPNLNNRQRILLESYNRCLATHPNFIESFYESFFEAMPELKESHFKHVNLDRQYKMLQSAQRAFLESGEDARFTKRLPNIKGHQGVTFDQFKIFIDTFINTIAASDPRWESTEVSNAWQQTARISLPILQKALENPKE